MNFSLQQLVQHFERNPVAARQAVLTFYERDAEQFRADSLPLLKDKEKSAGCQFLVSFLLSHGLLLADLFDPQAFTLEEAVGITKMAVRSDPAILSRMAQELVAGTASPAISSRMLDVVAAVDDRTRMIPHIGKMLTSSNPRIRSKAALLLGAGNNTAWLPQRLEDPDPRVRANALEAIWGSAHDSCRHGFRTALSDQAPRVVGNALVGLYLAGDTACIAPINRMATSETPRFRATAAWTAGRVASPRFLPLLESLQQDTDPSVRRNALRSRVTLQQRWREMQRAGSLVVVPTRWQPLADSRARVSVAVPSHQDRAEFAPSPVQFAVWQDNVEMGDYSLHGVARQEPLACMFLVDQSLLPPALAAIEGCLGLKRRGDSWSVAAFSQQCAPTAKAAPERTERLFGVEFAPAEAKAEPRTRPMPALTSDRASIRLAMNALDPDPLPAFDALRIATNAMAGARGGRHVFLIAASMAGLEDRVDDILAIERASVVVIHAIAPADAEPVLGPLCRESGGQFLPLPADSNAIPEILNRVYHHPLHRYELIYRRPDETPPSSIKIQVFSEHGYGEGALTL